MEWHAAAADLPMRRDIVEKVIVLLAKKGTMAKKNQKWLNKLRPTACQLEHLLYNAAASKSEYSDLASLTARLKRVVKKMSRRHAGKFSEQNGRNKQNICNNLCAKKTSSKEASCSEVTSKDRLVKQQHMLFLVLHAQFCRSTPNKCQVTPLCAKIKGVWAHAKDCKNGSKCPNAHCSAARWVFNHFRKCPNRKKCELCGPVLDATLRHNTIQQNLSSSFVSQTLRKCQFNMKRDRLSEKMEKVLTPSYKFRRICCA